MRKAFLAIAAAIPLSVAMAVPTASARVIPGDDPATSGTSGSSRDSGGSEGTGNSDGPARVAKAAGKKVNGQYIVTLKDGTGVSATTSGLGVKPVHTYHAAMNGFAAKLSSSQLRKLRHNPKVVAIEEDAVVHATKIQKNEPWGLDRIDERKRPRSGSYHYRHTGRGVTAYVIDTGIRGSHPTFGGRAKTVFNSAGGRKRDCNGHGTHVAGTIGGKRWGVAKRVRLRGIKVLDCEGSGTYSGVIAGVNWVTRHHRAGSVANMSLGGPRSDALNRAVTRMTRSGVFLAVAAGNENARACASSPAGARNVTVVAASNRRDVRASFSNKGRCVDVYAPGVNVRSAWLGGGSRALDGTSMASPHVAGAAAIYKQLHPRASSASVNKWIIKVSSKRVIKRSPAHTVKRLLFKRARL